MSVRNIIGEAYGDYFGWSVALSGLGDIIAIGAESNDGNGDESGHVRVFERLTTTSLGWSQIGGDLDGEDYCNYSGDSVAISYSGDIVAIGAPVRSIRVAFKYKYSYSF